MLNPPDYRTIKLEQAERIEEARQHRIATNVARQRRPMRSWFLPFWRKPEQARPARPARLVPDARF